MIRSEAAFTPYYALIGEDAARLSYLAEVCSPAARRRPCRPGSRSGSTMAAGPAAP